MTDFDQLTLAFLIASVVTLIVMCFTDPPSQD